MTANATLIGDGIENPANAVTMIHAAAMFGANCRFRDTKGLEQSLSTPANRAMGFSPIVSNEVRALHSRIVAFDNLPGAREVYGFNAGSEFTVLMGNERRGLSHELASLATDRVHIPMFSRKVNCLNVAAASAVALYYLGAPPVGRMAVRKDPRSRRPELLLLGSADHYELGSAIRSAAALGWERAFIEDRNQVWFGSGRAIRSEGRAAARRGKNDILLIPSPAGSSCHYARVTVVSCKPLGVPLRRVNLACGSEQLVVIADESQVETSAEDWSRFGSRVEVASLELPTTNITYHYRLIATIGLAEIARQVGRRPTARVPTAPRPPIYDHRFAELARATGEIARWEDLVNY